MKTVSMRGQRVDMGKLAAANSHKIAIGNASLNARGDKVGQQGVVLATREEMMSEYNISNPKAVKHVGLTGISNEVILAPAEAASQIRKQKADKMTAPKRQIADSEV